MSDERTLALWAELKEAAKSALEENLDLHAPRGPFDYVTFGEFGSPIETAMFMALVIQAHHQYITTYLFNPGLTLASASESPSNGITKLYPYTVGHSFACSENDSKRRLFPQCKIGKYSGDLLVEQGWEGHWARVVIECDGHDFHEKTKEQVRRDKARDRYMQTFGLSVLRFAGSEIHADPVGCAGQVHEFFEARHHEMFLRDEAAFEARSAAKAGRP